MPDTPLNPDAFDAAWEALYEAFSGRIGDLNGNDCERMAETAIQTYLAVALPEVTGEQVNFAGWTCNGIHEPGDYSTCNECREACDDLANFYNQMMRNPRPGKHWTGKPALLEVTSVEELDALPAKTVILDSHGDVSVITETGLFMCDDGDCYELDEVADDLPARVIYRPEVKP